MTLIRHHSNMGALLGTFVSLVLFGLIALTILSALRIRELERALRHMAKGSMILLTECGEHAKQIANQGQLLVLVANHVQDLHAKKVGSTETVIH